MFENETTLNEFLVAGLERVAEDIPDDRIGERAPGNGHPPVWILGHLEICAELGLHYFGHAIVHAEWIAKFGPGSEDDIQDAEDFDKKQLVRLIVEQYAAFRNSAKHADSDMLAEHHGVTLLANSPIQTRGQVISHLLTSHFGFHLAQLSSWRRAAGHKALF